MYNHIETIMKKFFNIFIFIFLAVNTISAFHGYKFTHFYDIGQVEVKAKADKNIWDKTKDILFGFNAVKKKNQVPDFTFENVVLITHEHLKLAGWYVKTTHSKKGTVLLFHGHGGRKSSILREAQAFRSLGYDTFLLDFRAHGDSEGNTSTIGWFESEDVRLAYDFVKSRNESNLILWGTSMGAAAITKSIYDSQLQVAKVILEMPYASLKNAASAKIRVLGLPVEPLATLVTFWGGAEHGFWAFNMEPLEFVKKITAPTLLLRGRKDMRVSAEETNAIFENIGHEKKLVVFEESDHDSICKQEYSKWLTTVSNFVN